MVLSLSNLERLGVCVDLKITTQTFSINAQAGWRTTQFGRRLLSACSEPGTYWFDSEEAKMTEDLKRVQEARREREDRRSGGVWEPDVTQPPKISDDDRTNA